MQQKKIIKRVVYILISVFLIGFCFLFYFWFNYINKSKLLNKYVVDNTKEVYILGTIDKKHFNKIYNYSMEDMLNVIDNIKPDLVMLDARQGNYNKYGVIDGSIDTCVAYSYCKDHSIPMEMIGSWIINNLYSTKTTEDLIEDNIFIKISRGIKNLPTGHKVLIISGNKHFHEQTARFDVAGFKRIKLDNISSYFENDNEEFSFPPLSSKVWKDRTYFYSYTFPNQLKEQEKLSNKIKDKYLTADHDSFYRKEIKYCKYLNNDILFK